MPSSSSGRFAIESVLVEKCSIRSLQRRVGQQVLVAPVAVAEDAGEGVGVGGLDGAHGLLECLPMSVVTRADVVPVRAVGDGEAVVLGQVGEFFVAVDLQRGRVLLVVHVGDPLQEDQRKDELLVVAGVDEAAQHDGRPPQIGLQLALGDARVMRHRPTETPLRESASSSRSSARVGVSRGRLRGRRAPRASVSISLVVRRRDVERDVEVVVVAGDLVEVGDVREAVDVGERS